MKIMNVYIIKIYLSNNDNNHTWVLEFRVDWTILSTPHHLRKINKKIVPHDKNKCDSMGI